METLFKDIRFGIRSLLKRPGFTGIAVITLALGIGATTAIFSVVNAVLLRPLPYPQAERLLQIGQLYPGGLAAAGEPKFLFWRDQSQSFEAMAAYEGFGAGGNLAGGSEAEYVDGLRVSGEFFRVLRVNPALGRAFTKEDDEPGGERVAILSDGLWRRNFGADPGLIGRTILLNGQTVTVVGVMARQFQFLPPSDLFTPMRPSLTGDPNPNATVFGRLKDGVTPAQAQAELKLIADKYRELHPNDMSKTESVGLQPYQDLFTRDVKQLLWILLGAVAFLLLIACANVANLQLTRAAAREKEIAVRQALGAGRLRIVRMLLTEGILLALIGGTAGALLALWGTQILVAAVPEGFIARAHEVSFDWRVLLFAFSAAIGTGVLFGLAPALQARRIDVNSALKESARRGGGARGRWRNALVVVEVALSLVLLVGALLLIRTFNNLRSVTPGFDAANVLTFQVDLKGEKYKTTNQVSGFYQEALERISRMPGVEKAAVTNVLPLIAQFNMPVLFPDRPDAVITSQLRLITPEYFRVMKIDLKQGRDFSTADNPGGPPVVIINEAFARRFLNSPNPFAQQLIVGFRGMGESPRQIIGIVSDVKQYGLDKDAPPMVFVHIPQVSDKMMVVVRRFVSAYFAVRTTVAPLSLSAAMKREIAAVDPTLAVSHVRQMEQVVARSVAPQRFNMLLVGLFAGLGLLLATVGIYGVVSYSVAQRTNEFGIRIALGADARDVTTLVLKQGLALAFLGVTLGLVASLALTRLMTSFLFGVKPTDVVSFATVSLSLLVVALLACYLPARRATKVDPLVALRYE
jgi:putative ABC transport system permease protein